MSLSGTAAMSILFLEQQSRYHHEVVRKDGGAHQEFESFATFGEAALHAPAAEQNGDAPLNAGTKTLGVLEGGTFLMGFLRRLSLTSALGNAHKANAGVFALLDVARAEKSAIGAVDVRDSAKCFPVTLKR